MAELTRLLARLNRGITNNANYVKVIKFPELLAYSLQELNDIIANDKIKDAIAKQVSYLITSQRLTIEHKDMKEDDVELNTVLYGSPGTGKALIATKLSKIWYSLGYLNAPNKVTLTDKSDDIPKELKELKESKESKESKDKHIWGKWWGAFNTSGNETMTYYLMFIFAMVFIFLLAVGAYFMGTLTGYWVFFMLCLLVAAIAVVGYFLFANENQEIPDLPTANISNDSNLQDEFRDLPIKNSGTNPKVETDDRFIKIVTRPDFVDRQIGSIKKTMQLLQENLGKVLFIDEAYTLITDINDSFGVEILVAINTFVKKHSKEIIVIFSGYKDLIESGVFSVQPDLRKRFRWHFYCDDYTPDQLFAIFKSQVQRKSWSLIDEISVKPLFAEYEDVFTAYGDDTEQLFFLSKLEHANDFVVNKFATKINQITTEQIVKAIKILKETNMANDIECDSLNPLTDIIKMFRGGRRPKKFTKQKVKNNRETEDKKNKGNDSNSSDSSDFSDRTFSEFSVNPDLLAKLREKPVIIQGTQQT